MIRIGIDQSLSFTGVTVMDENKNLLMQYGITHKKHTKWDKAIKANPSLGEKLKIIDYEYIEKSSSYSTFDIERIKYSNLINLSYTIQKNIFNPVWNNLDHDITVYMEGISFGSRQTTAIAELSALNYFIRERVSEMSGEFVIIPPSQVKKNFTGNGVADKGLMMETYFQLEPWAREASRYIKIDDIADSYAMACFDEICLDV